MYFSLGWSALMDNEFMRIALRCDGDYVVPRNPPGLSKYPEIVGPNQACTLYGATPGLDTVDGASYIAAGYSLNVHDLWRRNFLVLVGWFLFYQIAQVILIEYLNVSSLRISSVSMELMPLVRVHTDERMSQSSGGRTQRPRH
jgi:ATP-binding cassette subfamily G (WHITE) protein 2 (SNQ2)